jgi:hypothetical protein
MRPHRPVSNAALPAGASLVDAVATSDVPRRRLAVTLINRSPDDPEPAEVISASRSRCHRN